MTATSNTLPIIEIKSKRRRRRRRKKFRFHFLFIKRKLFDSMNDSCVLQLKEYFNSNPYREHAMNEPFKFKTRRLSNSSFEQLINKNETLDRTNYKLRMKSHLNVDNFNSTCRHRQQTARNPPIRSAKTTKTIKSIATDQLTRVEGNAVPVNTLNDLIRQYHQEELRLTQQPNQYFDTLLDYPINDRIVFKPPSFLRKQPHKQVQTLTEYRFDSGTSCPPAQPRVFSSTIDRSNLLTKRIQTSREKIHRHTEKQICICKKLNIIDPFNDKNSPSKLSSNGYIFPPIRAFGYFRRKSNEQTPLLIKKKIEGSTDSLDDLDNPPNTQINIVINH